MSGQFTGEVVVRWLSHDGADRKMELIEPFAFTAADGTAWPVPAGAVVDGASIPRIFWTTFGPPFVGDYRRASVVHDYYCDEKTRTWKATHRMFEHACRAGGVGRIDAKKMFLAVYNFGPRWETALEALDLPTGRSIAKGERYSLESRLAEDDFAKALRWIEDEDPELDAIEAYSDEKATVLVGPGS